MGIKKINPHHTLIDIAIEEALLSNVVKAKLSAVVTDKKLMSVFCKAHNKQFFGSQNGKFTIHAEEMLLGKNRLDLENHIVFLLRKKNNGLGESRPCPKCMTLLRASGVKRVAYLHKELGQVLESL